MTRINADIPVKRLSDQHLITEYYELPRVCTLYWKRKEKGHKFDDIPENFTLGSGHVKYFLNKGMFLYIRYTALIEELLMRGYRVNPIQGSVFEFDEEHFKPCEFTGHENDLVANRIVEKVLHINKRQTWSYYGTKLTPQQCVDIIANITSDEDLQKMRESYFEKLLNLKTFA